MPTCMAHQYHAFLIAYQFVNSFRESGNQVCMKHEDTNQFFLLILIVRVLTVSKKTAFFSLKPIYGGGDGGFLKYMTVIPLN